MSIAEKIALVAGAWIALALLFGVLWALAGLGARRRDELLAEIDDEEEPQHEHR